MEEKTRYAVGDELVENKRDADSRAREHTEELRELERDVVDDADLIEVKPVKVKVLVGAYNVVSERDGDVVVREVPEDVARAEAARLAGEQAEYRRDEPVHPFTPVDAGDLEPGVRLGAGPMVPSDPTPHPGYRVEAAGDRILEEV